MCRRLLRHMNEEIRMNWQKLRLFVSWMSRVVPCHGSICKHFMLFLFFFFFIIFTAVLYVRQVWIAKRQFTFEAKARITSEVMRKSFQCLNASAIQKMFCLIRRGKKKIDKQEEEEDKDQKELFKANDSCTTQIGSILMLAWALIEYQRVSRNSSSSSNN